MHKCVKICGVHIGMCTCIPGVEDSGGAGVCTRILECVCVYCVSVHVCVCMGQANN